VARSRDLFWRILEALGTTAAALELEEIGEHVYLQLVPDQTAGYSVTAQAVADVVFPAVLFSLETEVESRGVEDTGSTAWIFPARCWIADKNPFSKHGRIPIYLAARKALFDAFHEQPLAGVAEAVNMTVTPGVLFDPRLPNYHHLVSGFVVNVETQEDR
jgi:hypothetical protein